MEKIIGDTFIAEGKEVIVMADENNMGCKQCAFASRFGGACPSSAYDCHPCCATDRKDRKNVYFKLLHYVPEAKVTYSPWNLYTYPN